jgi:hypothetical protein
VTTFDAETEEWLTRLLEQAPPLSTRQQDLISTVFRDALTEKTASA